MAYKIAILGDFNSAYSTHLALNDSAHQCSACLNLKIECHWIGTDVFDPGLYLNGNYSGLWIAPGSPYKNMENVLKAISYARINNIPTLGNCGGFQHMLIEFARNVLDLRNADHEETNPLAEHLVISKLSCSLVQQEEMLTITNTNTLLFKVIQQTHFKGKYFCSYGLNPVYKTMFSEKGCLFTAFSDDGQPRAFELTSHPFFLGTLFQPALTSSKKTPDPVIVAFFEKCVST